MDIFNENNKRSNDRENVLPPSSDAVPENNGEQTHPAAHDDGEIADAYSGSSDADMIDATADYGYENSWPDDSLDDIDRHPGDVATLPTDNNHRPAEKPKKLRRGRERRRAKEAAKNGELALTPGSAEAAIGKSRKKRRVVKRVIIAVFALILAFAAAAFAYVQYLGGVMNAGVDSDTRNSLTQVNDGKPFYMLLMGIDKSQAREKTMGSGNFRSDSMILLRVDQQNKQVTLVSLHRDTLVDLGSNNGGIQKINAAHEVGGAALAISTVEKFAGVPISHYAEIDFDAFEQVVDAIGGVEVNVPIDIDDKRAGGKISKGQQTLNGKQALILCRSRHAYDAYGDGDLYRAANQRMVIGAIAQKILKSDVGTITNVANIISQYVTTDMTASDIISVAMNLRGISSDHIYSAMEPTVSRYVDGGWYEYCNIEAWRKIMENVDAGKPPTGNSEIDSNDGANTNVNSDSISNAVGVDSSKLESDTASSTSGMSGSGTTGSGSSTTSGTSSSSTSSSGTSTSTGPASTSG